MSRNIHSILISVLASLALAPVVASAQSSARIQETNARAIDSRAIVERLNQALEALRAREGGAAVLAEARQGAPFAHVLAELERDPAMAAFMQVHDICEERLQARGAGEAFRFESFLSKEYATVFEVVAPARPKAPAPERRSVREVASTARDIVAQLNAAIDAHFAAGRSDASFVGEGDDQHIAAVLAELARDRRIGELIRAHDVRPLRLVATGSGREFRFEQYIPREFAPVFEVVASRESDR